MDKRLLGFHVGWVCGGRARLGPRGRDGRGGVLLYFGLGIFASIEVSGFEFGVRYFTV